MNSAICRIAPYAASAPTLQCAPSESTNCASTPPKSCFLGGMLNRTPLALMSREKASTSAGKVFDQTNGNHVFDPFAIRLSDRAETQYPGVTLAAGFFR